ncbi:MAG: desulfoferrodoxin [Candidatus Pacebacteria bacterium]|nr:desulfoferrodoxin [Candidatus Paceibacterota bacterium]
MTKLNQIYKCNICGNMVEMVRTGVGQLVCCGENMELMQEKTQDEGQEKHVPVVEQTDEGIVVKVGSVGHPMLPEHHIEWIEIMFDDKVDRKFLKPGDKPEAAFNVKPAELVVREYCNVHGLWKAEK